MNIQNIASLAEQLHSLGFEDGGYLLLKRICFMPDSFVVSQRIEKGREQISFQLFFERNEKQDTYALMYYDAILQKETALDEATINGVEVANVEKQMTAIDWKKAFDFAEKKKWSVGDKGSWENEQKIESILTDLAALEATEEGKLIAVSLKLKYWTGSAYYELFDSIGQLRNKAEISQRFYCSEGQPGISVDEAYRFLQNRKLEKQMQAKRKQVDNQTDEEQEEGNNTSAGSGLLKKRRLNGGARTKKNKSTIQ
ncbi:MAG: hypothetical protein WAT19_16745 [Ferruginibacter sp.]